MSKIIHHMCKIYRKAEYQHWINTVCEYIKSHNLKKAWKWLKTTAKVDKFKNMSPEQGCTRFMYLNRLQGELTLLL